MEENKMLKVTIDGSEYAYPYGTPYKIIAADFQTRYPSDILLVNRDGKLCELHKVLDRDCSLKMITAQTKPGMQTYERSAVFLMLKAFYDVAGWENVERITAEYSVSNALFILARGNFNLDQTLLDKVEKRMRELAAQALPIAKDHPAQESISRSFPASPKAITDSAGMDSLRHRAWRAAALLAPGAPSSRF